MDPRIGQLHREDKIVYYANVGGPFGKYVEGTLAEVMVALGLGAPEDDHDLDLASTTPTRRSHHERAYIVHIKVKYPSWSDDPNGYDWECFAEDANGAIKKARKHMSDYVGHSVRTDGPVSYKARLSKDEKDERTPWQVPKTIIDHPAVESVIPGEEHGFKYWVTLKPGKAFVRDAAGLSQAGFDNVTAFLIDIGVRK